MKFILELSVWHPPTSPSPLEKPWKQGLNLYTSAFAPEVITQFRTLFLNMNYARNVRSVQRGESYQHLVGQSHPWGPLFLNRLLCRVYRVLWLWERFPSFTLLQQLSLSIIPRYESPTQWPIAPLTFLRVDVLTSLWSRPWSLPYFSAFCCRFSLKDAGQPPPPQCVRHAFLYCLTWSQQRALPTSSHGVGKARGNQRYQTTHRLI